VLAAAYINVTIQVIMEDSTMSWAAYDILDDRMYRLDHLFWVNERFCAISPEPTIS
jgi:hypothetical protein